MQALDALGALAEDPALQLRLQPEAGDLHFVHSPVLRHDRTAFDGCAETQRRRLLRPWMAAPGARAWSPALAARDGALVVGGRGGIEAPDS